MIIAAAALAGLIASGIVDRPYVLQADIISCPATTLWHQQGYGCRGCLMVVKGRVVLNPSNSVEGVDCEGWLAGQFSHHTSGHEVHLNVHPEAWKACGQTTFNQTWHSCYMLQQAWSRPSISSFLLITASRRQHGCDAARDIFQKTSGMTRLKTKSAMT